MKAYTSKAYRAYVSRAYEAFYGHQWSSAFEALTGVSAYRKAMMVSLSELMADNLMEYASRSGFFRSCMESDETRAKLKADREAKLAEIKTRADERAARDAEFKASLLPYSRHVYYENKCVLKEQS